MLEVVFGYAVVVEEKALLVFIQKVPIFMQKRLIIQAFAHKKLDAAALEADSVGRIRSLSHRERKRTGETSTDEL
jgi:hypothetical protein